MPDDKRNPEQPTAAAPRAPDVHNPDDMVLYATSVQELAGCHGVAMVLLRHDKEKGGYFTFCTMGAEAEHAPGAIAILPSALRQLADSIEKRAADAGYTPTKPIGIPVPFDNNGATN